jgi:two-component system chemotaxis response regulator CheY
MRVLIVDSSIQIVRRLEEMLLAAKTTRIVYSSDSYEQALQIFTENKPDVVLLSISLPENQSIKLLGEIKAVVYKTSVIILSINMNQYIHEQCIMLGADYFFDKYYDFEKIPVVINRIAGGNNVVH